MVRRYSRAAAARPSAVVPNIHRLVGRHLLRRGPGLQEFPGRLELGIVSLRPTGSRLQGNDRTKNGPSVGDQLRPSLNAGRGFANAITRFFRRSTRVPTKRPAQKDCRFRRVRCLPTAFRCHSPLAETSARPVRKSIEIINTHRPSKRAHFAARPLPPIADISPGRQSVGQAAQLCLGRRCAGDDAGNNSDRR